MTSQLSTIFRIPERSEATPGLWNAVYDQIDANFAAVDITNSGSTLSIGADLWLAGSELIGENPSYTTRAALKIAVRSDTSDYIYFEDSSAAKSDYLIGSRVGGTADGLNLYDVSGDTMLVSFSKQSIRFYQNVVGPVFDVGGALADTLNAATFGTGADSVETRIQAAINQASIDGISRVYVPANMYPYSASSVSFVYTVQMVREGGDFSVFDVAAYGIRKDPTTLYASNSSSIQAAVNSAIAAGGGMVFFPPGVFGITSGISLTGTSEVIFQGSGRNVTEIAQTSNNVALFDLNGAVTRVQIRDMWIGSFAARPSGWGLRAIGGATPISELIVERVTFQDLATPISLTSVHQSALRDVRYLQGITGATVNSVLSMARCQSMHISELVTISTSSVLPTHILVLDSGCDTCIFRDIELYGGGANTRGVNIVHNTAAAGPPRLLRFTDSWVEDAGAGGFVITNGRDIRLNHCHTATCDDGYLVSGGNSISLVGCYAMQDNAHGFDIIGGNGVRVIGCTAVNNSAGTDNTFDGFHIDSGVTGVEIIGNRAGNFVFPANPNKQRYGLYLDTTVNYITALGNNLEGNVTGNQLVASTGTMNFIMGLDFFRTTAAGGLITPAPVFVPSGALAAPTLAFSSESSLGWYRSGTSQMALSYGTFLIGMAGSGDRIGLGTLTPSFPIHIKVASDGTFANATFGTMWSGTGAGFGNFLAVSNQTITKKAILATNQTYGLGIYIDGAEKFSVNSLGRTVGVGGGVYAPAGSAIDPAFAISSESSLGFYRSAASTLALSYGTLRVGELYVTSSGISVGNATAGGSLIRAISSMSSLVGAFVVQPSSSSFTVVTWAAAQPGDQILTTVMQSGAVSSLSSGLVLHSHCTQAGQIEFRLSNVSTLVQNQSSRSYFFTRISPF